MKIAAIDVISLDVPLRVAATGETSTIANGRTNLPMLFVRIDTDDGVTGWGEAFAYHFRDATRLILQNTVVPRLLDCDASGKTDVLEPIMREFRNCKAGLLTYAVSAIDIALWDIAAKRARLPLCQLFAADPKSSIPAYASLVRYSNPALAVQAVDAMVKRGYRQVKLHENECSPVAAVRDHFGNGISIAVDASSGWSLDEALGIARLYASLGIDWLEEPTWPPEDYEALAHVGKVSGLRIAAGENSPNLADFKCLCANGGISILQPSVCKLGGVTETWRAMSMGAVAGHTVIPHVYYLGPGLLASLHLAAAFPQALPLEHAIFDLETEPFGSELCLSAGAFPVPRTHGIGPGPDPTFIARYRQL